MSYVSAGGRWWTTFTSRFKWWKSSTKKERKMVVFAREIGGGNCPPLVHQGQLGLRSADGRIYPPYRGVYSPVAEAGV